MLLRAMSESGCAKRASPAKDVPWQWQEFAQNQRREGANKRSCLPDLQPVTTIQAPDRDGMLNIGGFSDAAFCVIASFLSGGWFAPGFPFATARIHQHNGEKPLLSAGGIDMDNASGSYSMSIHAFFVAYPPLGYKFAFG